MNRIRKLCAVILTLLLVLTSMPAGVLAEGV